jgi:hypothetical protein
VSKAFNLRNISSSSGLRLKDGVREAWSDIVAVISL